MRSTRLTAPTILRLLVALPAQAQNGAPRARRDAAGHKVGERSRSELIDQKGAVLPNDARDGESYIRVCLDVSGYGQKPNVGAKSHG